MVVEISVLLVLGPSVCFVEGLIQKKRGFGWVRPKIYCSDVIALVFN